MSGLVVLRRIAMASGVLALALALVLATTVTTVVRRSFPQREGTLSLAGLSAPVTVRRDARGVPQIYADTADDLFRAQGFVHAQDRFFEMDLRRHVTAGRLSELVGVSERALSSDKVVRTLGWRRVARHELPLLSPDVRRYLQDYADGVNAYIAGRSPAELGVEYTILGVGKSALGIEPWSALDSLTWLKAMAWDLRANYDDEVTRARLSATLPIARIEQLYPPYPFTARPPVLLAPSGSPTAADRSSFATSAAASSAAAGPAAAGPAASAASLSAAPWRTSVRGLDAPAGPNVAALSAAAMRSASGARALARTQQALDAVPALLGHGAGIGSNAWAVAGWRTTTGKPLLANDPHLAPSLPGIWYQMGLHCRTVGPQCPFDVAGFTFSGFPGVIIGHNARIAWGLTNLGTDVTDLYLERVVGGRVEVDGRLDPVRQHTETIAVRGSSPVTITVRSTRHGPIVSDVLTDAGAAGRGAPVDGTPDSATYDVALAWTALTPGRTAQAVFALDAAQDWSQFRSAARLFAVPAQNLVYADVSGTIGYQAPGEVPLRRGFDGRWPVPGWLSRYDWKGRVPFAALPSQTNPADGLLVSANQPASADPLPFLTADWDYGYRAGRIRDLLQRKGSRALSAADMSAVQLDTRNPMAPVLVPYLLGTHLGRDTFTAEAQVLLRGWDYTQPPGSAPAAYYNAVWRNLLRLTFDDELGADLAADGSDRWFEVVSRLLNRPRDIWWDNKASAGLVESRDEILRQAMVAARIELTKSLGKEPARWQWGRLHRLTLRHPVLGSDSVPAPVRALVNRGPWQLGGGSAIVDATGWTAAQGFSVDRVPSMRMVVDLSDLDRSRWINLTGASGHPFDAHYDDQSDGWADGATYAWPFSRAAVQRSTTQRLLLGPRR